MNDTTKTAAEIAEMIATGNRNEVEVVEARATGKFGEMTLTRTDFDVIYKVGNATEWSVERQSSYTIRGDGLSMLGQGERAARARWARSLVTFEAVQA